MTAAPAPASARQRKGPLLRPLLLLRKPAGLVRELGLLTALLHAADRAGLALGGAVRVRPLIFYSHAVPDRPLLPPGRAGGFALRGLTADEAAAAGVPVPPPLLAGRRRPEIRCVALFKDGAAIGHQWINLGPHDDEMVRCRFLSLPAGRAAWTMDLFIAPPYRAGLAFARLWDGTHAELRARGIAFATGYVAADNPAARAAEERLGGRRVGRAVFVKLGPWQLTLATRAPRLHLATAGAPPPAIVLPPPGGAGR